MKVTHLDRAAHYEPHEGWRRSSLCDEPGLSLEHFIKPPGHESPVHHHPEQQVTLVIKGTMKVVAADGAEAILQTGDAAFFAANEPHQVINLLDEASIGVDIFNPGRSFDFWLKRKK